MKIYKQSIIVAGGIIFGVLLRIVIWHISGMPINLCSALWGITSRNIRPLFFFDNQPLIGAVGAYMEFLFLFFVKLNSFTNSLAELTFSALFIFSSYLLGKEVFGRIGGIIALVLSAVVPYKFMILSVMPIANYQAVLFFGNIIFLLVYRICYSNSDSNRISLWIFLGLVSGIALWSNVIVMPYLLTGLIFLNIKNQRLLFSKNMVLLILFFIAGSLPFWARNINEAIGTIQKISLDTAFFNRIGNAVFFQIPAMLGFLPLNLLGMFLYIIALIYAIYVSRDGFKSITKLSISSHSGLEMPLIFLVLALIMFSKFGFYNIEGADDFIVIYPVFILFAVKLLLDIKKKSKNIFTGMFSMFIAANVISVSGSVLERSAVEIKESKAMRQFVSFFESKEEYCGEEIPAGGWKAISNFNPEETNLAWDRDLNTRWTTHRWQGPDMYYELDLGMIQLIGRIVMIFNPDRYDYPRAFKIELSINKKAWDCVTDVSHGTMEHFYSGEYPFFKDCEIRFNPRHARYIKLTQTSRTYENYWSIRELFVYGLCIK